jgi:hypothetical protein
MVGFYFKRRLALANSISLAGSSTGQFILPPLVTLLIDHYSVRGALIILAGVMFNITLAGALLRPTCYYKKRKPKFKVTFEPSKQSCKSDFDEKLDTKIGLRKVISNKHLDPATNSKSLGHSAVLNGKDSTESNGRYCNGVTSAPNLYSEYILDERGAYSSLKNLPSSPEVCLKKKNTLLVPPQYETFIYASNGDLFTSTQNVTITDHQVASSQCSPQANKLHFFKFRLHWAISLHTCQGKRFTYIQATEGVVAISDWYNRSHCKNCTRVCRGYISSPEIYWTIPSSCDIHVVSGD